MVLDDLCSNYFIAGAHRAPPRNPDPHEAMTRSETIATLKTLADFASTLAITAEEMSQEAAEAAEYGKGYDDVDVDAARKRAASDVQEAEGLLEELKSILEDLDEAPDDLPARSMED